MVVLKTVYETLLKSLTIWLQWNQMILNVQSWYNLVMPRINSTSITFTKTSLPIILKSFSGTCWWFNVSAVVLFNPLENSSFCFTNMIIIIRCFRTCPRVNYIMFVVKVSFVIDVETWTKFASSKRNFQFCITWEKSFYSFSNWLNTC